MTRRHRFALVGSIAVAFAAGCTEVPPPAPSEMDAGEVDRPTILKNVIQLIREAHNHPGGTNFDIATENLNDYFLDAKADDFALSDATMRFLGDQKFQGHKFPPGMLDSIAERRFLKNDGRHIEDNLLYHALAARVAGEGDDLARVRRIFDWTVRHVMLVPPQSLVPAGMAPAQARPYDVLMRGMAVESGGGWSERGWLFIALCRQIGVDAGIVAYSPRSPLGPVPPAQARAAAARREHRSWIVCALVDGKPYLFDPQIGMPILSADGLGVATLDEACTDPAILARYDLPGRGYEPSRADLAARPVKVLLEASFGSLSPRMRLLQRDLAGKNRMVLYRDPLEQAAAFRKALGPRCGGVDLWWLPLQVEFSLFNDSNFVHASQISLQLFDPRLPLLSARLNQLHGDLPAAMQSYVVFRFAEKALQTDGKSPIPPQIQQALDVYATYFLALAQEEKGDVSQAKFLFGEALKMLPEPDPTLPPFVMFRWGAETNLGLIYADAREPAAAARFLSRDMPTSQVLGNHVRARALILGDPFVPPAGTPIPFVPAQPAKSPLG